jgi:hypothetical protein
MTIISVETSSGNFADKDTASIIFIERRVARRTTGYSHFLTPHFLSELISFCVETYVKNMGSQRLVRLSVCKCKITWWPPCTSNSVFLFAFESDVRRTVAAWYVKSRRKPEHWNMRDPHALCLSFKSQILCRREYVKIFLGLRKSLRWGIMHCALPESECEENPLKENPVVKKEQLKKTNLP